MLKLYNVDYLLIFICIFALSEINFPSDPQIMYSFIKRLPKGCKFSHTSNAGEPVYIRLDSKGIKHFYIKYDNGMCYHFI